MDLGLLAAIILLVLWFVGTFFLDAPGLITLALSLGVFLLIWRIVARPSTTQSGEKAHLKKRE